MEKVIFFDTQVNFASPLLADSLVSKDKKKKDKAALVGETWAPVVYDYIFQREFSDFEVEKMIEELNNY